MSTKTAGVTSAVQKAWGGALKHTGNLANRIENVGGTLGSAGATAVRVSPYVGLGILGHKAISSGPVQDIRQRWRMHQMNKAQNMLEKGGSAKTAAPSQLGSAFLRGLTFRSMKPVLNKAGKPALDQFGNLAEHTGAEHVMQNLGHLTGASGIVSGVAEAGHLVHKGAKKGENKIKSKIIDPRNMQAIIAAHPILAEADPNDVQMAYKSVKRLAPSIASDPLAAGSVMKNIIALKSESTGMMIDPSTIKTLADTQKAIHGGKPEGNFMKAFTGQLKPLSTNDQVEDWSRRKVE